MRASAAQFDNILPIEHSYYLVRSARQMDRVLREIEAAPGVVMFTISNDDLREKLEQRCREIDIPFVAVLDPVLEMMRRYLGIELNHRIGAGRVLDAEYFRRIEALNYAMSHDDGQSADEIDEADVFLVGVSRTSKTPTCVYLANRGVKAGNIPIVPQITLPEEVLRSTKPLVVGLTVSPDRLIHVRRNRLQTLNEQRSTDYIDEEAVRAEVVHAARIFERQGWPVIDVTRRSIEETAAAVLNLLTERRRAQDA
jgi:regulator of PEP synthase PpsR (kinase-PPPase family)